MSEFVMHYINTSYENQGLSWSSQIATTNNIQLKSVAKKAGGIAISALGGVAGIPQVVQIGSSLFGESTTYSVSALDQYNDVPGVLYPDHRARKGGETWNPLLNRRDGASAAARGSLVALSYAGASATLAGPYSIFNLQGFGKTGFGFGDYDNPYAIREDFTLRSHVTTKWQPGIAADKKGKWTPTTNPLEILTPFRGDKVNIIDFSQRTRDDIYRWKPTSELFSGALGRFLDNGSYTQDFIKFYFTGPKLQNGADGSLMDDVIVFRAIINSLSDTFAPTWTPVQMIGRADSNYHYSSYARDLNLDFVIAATDRDELKPIYRKLNALASYTAPEYDTNNIAPKGPWLRFTVGDLLVQQPAFITSLTFNLIDNDTTWEINIEQDNEMMQVPHKISVNMGLTLITDYLPQKGGQFYTLSKQWDEYARSKQGNDNWLSDAKTSKVETGTVTVGNVVRTSTYLENNFPLTTK